MSLGEEAIVGEGGFAEERVDDVMEFAGEVFAHGQVDGAGVLGHRACDDGVVELVNGAGLELDGEVSMGGGGEGEDHEAGGIAVESMHGRDVGEGLSKSRGEAVSLVGAASGHGEEAGGFIDDEDGLIVMEDERIGDLVGHANWPGREWEFYNVS